MAANDSDGLDAGNNMIVDDNAGVIDPGGVLASWSSFFGGTGTYTLLLSTPTVLIPTGAAATPEPATVLLALASLAGVAASVLRRRHAA